MKKILSILLFVLLIITSFVGCSSNKKSEEQLRTEIKKELEAEQEEELKGEVKTEVEAEKKGSDIKSGKEAASNNEQKAPVASEEQKKPALNNFQGSITVDASDLKVGDMINGHVIDKLTYKKGDELGIGLRGEFTVSGEILYDDFFGAIVLSTNETTASPTKIKYKFDSEFVLAPPSGTFVIDGNNLDAVKSAAPDSFLNDIQNGKIYKTKLVINNYAFVSEKNSEPGWSSNIVKIIDFEANNEQSTEAQTDKTSGTSTGFSSENINGVQVGFNSDDTIIVPMYNGVNISKLESVSRDITINEDSMTMELNFAVFGQLRDVVVTYYEGMGSYGIPTELGTFKNANIKLKVYAPNNDMTYLKVTGKVNGEASLIDVEFTLDDMRDPSDYKVIAY